MVAYHINMRKSGKFATHEINYFGAMLVIRNAVGIENGQKIVYGFKQSEENIEGHDNLIRINLLSVEDSKTREGIEAKLGKNIEFWK